MRRGIGRLRAGGSAAVALPTTTAMESWYRKGVGITSAANAVSVWVNQAVSGAARNLAQATGAAQPTLQAGGTIIFDGTSDFLAVSYAVALPRTRYIRFRPIAWSSNVGIISGNTVNTGLVFQLTATPNIGSYNNVQGPQNAAATVGAWASLCVTTNNTVGDILRINATSVTGVNAGASAIDGMVVGSNGGGAGFNFSNIEVAEIIDYSAEHNAAQQDPIIAYLNTL